MQVIMKRKELEDSSHASMTKEFDADIYWF